MPRHRDQAASPLGPVLAFTGLASFAAGTATIGIFFVTDAAYGFSALENYLLALLVGATYTLGALGASAARRALGRLGLAPRGLLASISVLLGLFVLVPLFSRSKGLIFLLLGLYAPLTGAFWPVVESYVSGGRRAGQLRSAMGRFNVVWSATLVPAFWGITPLLERSAELVFVCVAALHGASLLFLLGFRPAPGVHAEEAHAVPAGYPELLRVHRVLHAMSYLVMYALSPALPGLLAALALPPAARGLVASTWLAARVLGFAALERWHGWHGRWSAASAGTALVLAGFGGTVLAPHCGALALPLLLLGLFAFGLGLAALYTAALYYAFEVGGSEGGGSHEALIGLGYSAGPLCGLAACGAQTLGLVSSEERQGLLLFLVALVSLAAAFRAWRHRREGLERGAPAVLHQAPPQEETR
jgi:hypothetical protein